MRPTYKTGPESILLRPVALRTFVRERLSDMHPAYFAFVMATGIMAIGAHLLGLAGVAWVLSRINLIAYPAMCALFFVRVVAFPERVWNDCKSHQRAPGFFTVIAATSVFGVQTALIHLSPDIARALWWVTVALWSLANYGIFALLIINDKKPSLATGINGGWLVSVVATQSVVVLGCIVDAVLPGAREISSFTLLCFWLCGGVLYLWIISLIFYRYFFYDVSPGDLMPPYWINMGAMAISTLAGALLCTRIHGSALLSSMAPFIKGITVAYWATATWWIPMLVVLGIWRHGIRRFPFNYDPLYWGLVFPLGMYAVCTFRLGGAIDTPGLLPIAKLFLIAGVLAWLSTFLGLSRRILFGLVLTFRALRAVHGPELVTPPPETQEIECHEFHPYARRD